MLVPISNFDPSHCYALPPSQIENSTASKCDKKNGLLGYNIPVRRNNMNFRKENRIHHKLLLNFVSVDERLICYLEAGVSCLQYQLEFILPEIKAVIT